MIAISGDGDNSTNLRLLHSFDQGFEQQVFQPLAGKGEVGIDRVSNGKTISRARLIRTALSVCLYVSVQFRGNIWHVERACGVK